MSVDLDHWLALVTGRCQPLPEAAFLRLCRCVSEVLTEECSVTPVASPITVCGDIHGHFSDLLEALRVGGSGAPLQDTRFLFMGNYVDRGEYGLETVTLLFLLKARYPDRVVLLRGNHEGRLVTKVYGFYDECINKYGNANAWRACCKVFDLLTVAALIDETVLCVHGGLSPEIKTLDQIRTIDRNQEIPHKGPFCDIVWSDPDDVSGWKSSPRGAGYLFGPQEVHQFSAANSLQLICRGHQLVVPGYQYRFTGQLLTVWSQSNHLCRLGNPGAVVHFLRPDVREHRTFRGSTGVGKLPL